MITFNKTKSCTVVIEEQFIESRTGNQQDCEDLIHTSENYIAVIDGATSKTGRDWNNESDGIVAAKLIDKAFHEMPHNYTARQAADLMTAKIFHFYKEKQLLDSVNSDPGARIAATVAAVNLDRQEIWSIGDCQVMLGTELLPSRLKLDLLLSEIRALFLRMEILKGGAIEQLQETDNGRAFIFPLLKGQAWFQNNRDAGEYWFPVVNGFPIPDSGISIKKIPGDVVSIILASDGYPVVKDNLADTELALQEILKQDPLLIYEYKSTKGLMPGNKSFDDRAYIRMKLKRNL